MSLPRWLPPRRALTLLALSAASAAAVIWNHRQSHAGFLAQVEQALPLSAALSADALHDWIATRSAQADVLAAIAGSRESGSANDASIRHALTAITVAGKFSAATLIRATTPLPRLRLHVVDDSLSTVDFSAPIVGTNGSPPQHIVLSAIANEAAFSHFNVAAPTDRTQRTALLWVDADSVQLVTASAPGGVRRSDTLATARSRASIDGRPLLDSAYRAAVLASAARPTHGIGRGLYGQPVVYARVPVPGTPWVLVRERDVAELSALIASSVLVTDAIFALLASLIVGVIAMLWRSAYLRRESESLQLRSTFVSSVSHELRTPLTQIRMYAEMLRHGMLREPADADRALGVIEKEAERLSLLVERSLNFVRSGQVAAPSPSARAVLADAVRTAIAVVAPIATERAQQIALDLSPSPPAHIDPDALHQVLLNVLDNAIKYGPQGQTIRVSVSANDRVARITVDDEGPGVPREEREHIWAAFARGRLAQEHPALGSGIGLAVVRDLVQRADGRAWVESRVGAPGARFVVELPALERAAETTNPASA